MHKEKQTGGKVTLIPKFQFGTGQGGVNLNVGSGWLAQQAPSWLSGLSGTNSPFGGLMKDTPTSAGAATSGFDMNRAIGSGLNAVLGATTNIGGIQSNTNLSGAQKRMMTGDATVDAIGQAAGMLGPVGGLIGQGLGLINKIGGSLIKTPKVLKDFKVNDSVAQSSGYTGTAANAGQMVDNASTYKNAGLIGKLFGNKKRLSSDANMLNTQQTQVADILKTSQMARDRGAASADMFANNNNNKLYGGNMWNNGSIQYGQLGMKFTESGSSQTKTYEEMCKKLGTAAKKLDLKKFKNLKRPPVLKVEPNVPNLAEGGKLNVIVEGKLHAHKHDLKDIEHLEDANITLKGVPVVSAAEGGEIVQHAEVERDELILHYECSQALEELYEDGSDEAMVKAGKLLAKELCRNTKDSSSKILANG